LHFNHWAEQRRAEQRSNNKRMKAKVYSSTYFERLRLRTEKVAFIYSNSQLKFECWKNY